MWVDKRVWRLLPAPGGERATLNEGRTNYEQHI